MKERLLTAVILLATVVMQSCTDDDLKKGGYVEQGSEIRFGASLEADNRSRTHYDPNITDASTTWPIFWNYQTNLDTIYIYSPQGATGRNQASYVVKPDSENQSTAATITKTGAFGVQAGATEGEYDFYGFYPASAVKEEIVSGTTTIKATLSGDQTVSYQDQNGNVIPFPAKSSAEDVTIKLNPDMRACMMVAKNEGVTLTNDEAVTVNFSPFSTLIDINIPGPTDLNTLLDKNECAVTSVMVEADAPIAGDFTYDFKTGELAFGENAKNNVVITTMAENTEGNITGFPIQISNTLNVKAYLLPNPAVTSITIRVFTADNQVWEKKLAGVQEYFKPKQVHKVTLPKLQFEGAPFDYSRWLSQMDPRIYISELSMPGSTSSFSWALDENSDDRLQSLRAVEQFKAGIRVFRCHVWLYDEASIIDGQSPSFGINVKGSVYARSMATVVRELYEAMQAANSDEFCVLMVSDYKVNNYNPSPGQPSSPSNAPYNNDNGKTFYERFKVISQRMAENGWCPEHIDANTTIEDVKGKVIVKLQLNADGGESDGTCSNTENTNNTLSKIKGWSTVNGSEALFNWWTSQNGSRLFYAPMVFGEVGSFEIGTFPDSNSPKPAITSYTNGLAYDAANRIVNSSKWSWVVAEASRQWNGGNANLSTNPGQGVLDAPGSMWYIYGAQAAAGSNYSDAEGLIGQAVSAITKTYNATTHNKFYMTYLGGSAGRTGGIGSIGGTTYTVDQISTNFIREWNTQIGTWGDRPYGWVLFNTIPAANSNPTGVQATIAKSIKKVIAQNNKFTLARKKNSTPAAAPKGDVKGVSNGGYLFR